MQIVHVDHKRNYAIGYTSDQGTLPLLTTVQYTPEGIPVIVFGESVYRILRDDEISALVYVELAYLRMDIKKDPLGFFKADQYAAKHTDMPSLINALKITMKVIIPHLYKKWYQRPYGFFLSFFITLRLKNLSVVYDRDKIVDEIWTSPIIGYIDNIPVHLVNDAGYTSVVVKTPDHQARIAISRNLQSLLTENELLTVCQHEAAHVYYGHLDKDTDDSIDLEYRADRYAAEQTSTDSIVSVLQKLLLAEKIPLTAGIVQHLHAINYRHHIRSRIHRLLSP